VRACAGLATAAGEDRRTYASGGITDEAARFAARHLGEAPGLCSTTKGWPNALGGTPQEFAATIAHDVAVWREAVRLTGGLER
jgi:hypothetical protein